MLCVYTAEWVLPLMSAIISANSQQFIQLPIDFSDSGWYTLMTASDESYPIVHHNDDNNNNNKTTNESVRAIWHNLFSFCVNHCDLLGYTLASDTHLPQITYNLPLFYTLWMIGINIHLIDWLFSQSSYTLMVCNPKLIEVSGISDRWRRINKFFRQRRRSQDAS